jgi:hypothetical protein
VEIAKEKFDGIMAKYGQCSGGGLEKKTAEAFTAAVQKSVTDSQRFADAVVNLIGVRRTTDQKTGEVTEQPADYESAKEALTNLAKSVGPVAEHWRPFVELACEALEVDVSMVLPRGMVPDPAALERALEERSDQLSAEMKRNTDLELSLSDMRKQLDSATSSLKSANDALEVANKTLESARKAQADLAAENEALKSQLANATKADTSAKPEGKRK